MWPINCRCPQFRWTAAVECADTAVVSWLQCHAGTRILWLGVDRLDTGQWLKFIVVYSLQSESLLIVPSILFFLKFFFSFHFCRCPIARLAVDMKFPIHIHIHRFSVDIHGYPRIYPYPQTPNLRTCSPQFWQNTAMQKCLSPPPRKTWHRFSSL